MADIWISLKGDNNNATGSIDAPYRDLSVALGIWGDTPNTRFVFAHTSDMGYSVFEDESLVLNNKTNIHIMTDKPNQVILKLPNIEIFQSKVFFKNLIFQHNENLSLDFFIKSLKSNVTFEDLSFMDFTIPPILLEGSINYFNECIFKVDNIGIDVINVKGNARFYCDGGIKIDGNYNSGIITDGHTIVFNANKIWLSGQFDLGLDVRMENIDASDFFINDLIISPSNSSCKGGIFYNIVSINKISYIRSVLINNCLEGISFNECDLMLDKATIVKNNQGIIANINSRILVSNSIFSYNSIALESNDGSDIQLNYCNFWNNTQDYPESEVPAPDFEVSLHGELNYSFPESPVIPNSEKVYYKYDPKIVYTKDVDYKIFYGSQSEVAYISRISDSNGGDIPLGQTVIINYKIPSSTPITGTISESGRIRRVDPFFNNIDDNDYSLNDHSPLIDAGFFVGLGNFYGEAPDLGYWERTKPPSNKELITRLNLKSSNKDITMPPDIKNTILLQEENLKANIPNIDVTEGSVAKDLLIKPGAHMIDPLRVRMNLMLFQQSLLNYNVLTEEDMDLLASNYFISRHSGEFATGIVRIYLNKPVDFKIPAGTVFKSGDLEFVTTNDYHFLEDEIAYNSDEEHYFVDVTIKAVEIGSKYVIGPGQIREVINLYDSNIVSVSNIYGTIYGRDKENNVQLYDRIKNSLSVRALVNNRAINTVLKENFPVINQILTIGARDPEMNRDIIIEIEKYAGNKHVYGKVDIYVAFNELFSYTHEAEIDENGFVFLNSNTVQVVPMIIIDKIMVLDEGGNEIKQIDDVEYVLSSKDPEERFSIREELTLKFEDKIRYSLQNIRIYYKSHVFIKYIQEFVESDSNRVVCSDLLIKSFRPKVINFEIYYKTDNDLIDISEDVISETSKYINSLEPGSSFNVSDLYPSIREAGASSFATPITSYVEEWDVNGRKVIYTSTDEIQTTRIQKIFPGEVKAFVIS